MCMTFTCNKNTVEGEEMNQYRSAVQTTLLFWRGSSTLDFRCCIKLVKNSRSCLILSCFSLKLTSSFESSFPVWSWFPFVLPVNLSFKKKRGDKGS